MKTVAFPNGETVPAMGLGTWHMGERGTDKAAEVRALQAGIDCGMTVIDTAEMYAGGGAERVVGEAIAGRRDGLFIVSKVMPSNAGRAGTTTACDKSLQRMGIATIDLYLLHWPGPHPLAETVAGFTELQQAGKIRGFGVSNFDVGEMQELWDIPGGDGCWSNQILYNLNSRGVEWDLLPWCAKRRVPVMAYSPLDQGRLDGKSALGRVAARHGCSAMQIALAWSMRADGVLTIPKASNLDHVAENRAAADIALLPADLADLDAAFAPPKGKGSLALL